MARQVHASLSALAALLLGGAANTALGEGACPGPADPVALGSAQWNGWGRSVDNTRYQPEPAIRDSDVSKLKLKWAYGYQNGTEFGQPTVVDGRLFVASSSGRIYSLDAKTGCTYWTYDAAAGSRTAIIIGELARARIVALPRKLKRTLAHLDVIKAPSAAFFGDDTGAVYALDAQKGTLLWKTQVDTHPLARIVGSPTLFNDRLYVAVSSTEDSAAANPSYSCCTFRGSVAALDIAGGKMLWKSYTVLEEPVPTRKNSAGIQEFGPAGAAISSSPTIDGKRNVLYVATGSSATGIEQSLTDAVVAFDLGEGKLRWVKQLVRPDAGTAGAGFASSPVLRTLNTGNQVLLAGQQSGVVYGLDPDHGGDILWQTKVGDSAASGAGPRAGVGGSASGVVSVVGPPGVAGSAGGVAWGSAADHRNLYVATSGLLAQPTNPSGSLTALDMTTGVARWHTPAPEPPCAWAERACSHAQAQAVTVMPGSAFSGSMDGHLRAYSTIDGKILWDFDTARDFQTKNGVKASGGPLDHGGATIVNGTVYLNSGNALLAFSVEGK
ncbi:MAG TPA: PQQ-binding-like beta-propeller repeat protein [Steroidobacteraceae bacterium]|nr:PQQ-binding-like beta-propeller repeat protein [Steroidobacteraceae bacterium]